VLGPRSTRQTLPGVRTSERGAAGSAGRLEAAALGSEASWLRAELPVGLSVNPWATPWWYEPLVFVLCFTFAAALGCMFGIWLGRRS